MKYDIYISDYKRNKVLQFPILPSEIPTIKRSCKNEEFETFNNGSFNLIGNIGLASLSFSSWLPGKGKNYNFQRVKNVNADSYIQLIEKSMLTKQPVRFIVVRGDGTSPINSLFSVESFEWYEDKKADYVFSIDLKEWREY
ncbi:MAG: hypothetical protein RR891_02775 [Clostridium sp.]